jgi:hypothetical protein
MGFFPKVDKPNSPDASMIVLQFGIDNKGELETFSNANWSMIIPVLLKEDSSLVPFRVSTGLVDMTNFYYKENLKAGKYTLTGFMHVYTDYGKLAEYETQKGSTEIVAKNAYDDKPYRVKQFFPLEKPVVLDLKPNIIASLGMYVMKYKYKEGISGTSDDRWKMQEDYTKIVLADSEDQSLLSYMKPWATKKWKMWNAKNPATKK